MLTRRVFAVAATTVVLVPAGCSDTPSVFETSLDQGQARTELAHLGIVIPDSYTLTSMTRRYMPAPGGPDYDGAFTSPTPPAPILVAGAAAVLTPATCQSIPVQAERWSSLGLDCARTDMRYGSAESPSASVMVVDILSGTVSTGESRIFITVIGN